MKSFNPRMRMKMNMFPHPPLFLKDKFCRLSEGQVGSCCFDVLMKGKWKMMTPSCTTAYTMLGHPGGEFQGDKKGAEGRKDACE